MGRSLDMDNPTEEQRLCVELLEQRDKENKALREENKFLRHEVGQRVEERDNAREELASCMIEQARRDHRIGVFETISCALATLRRLDHAWYDDDIREVVTQVRSSLSVAQSKIKERIDG